MTCYQDNYSIFRKQAENLVANMTLEEAASQLRYDAPAIPRLDIPAYNWWNEALHGVARAGVSTMFPQAIALAAMFDKQTVKQMAEIIAEEARAKYNEQVKWGDRDIYKGLTFWAPNINIFRDPRWGRGHETYGEDPFLTARLGVAYIQGLQGEGTYMKAAACAKHFAVHSGPESERHHFDAIASKRDLWDTYLPAFEACVKEAQVEAIMGAYNRTNGEPCCGSKTLIQEILREQWGFRGHFVSDCWAIRDFHAEHKITATAPESAALALQNGCDVNCGITYLHLMQAYQDGLVTEEQIRESAIRLFTTRYKLGMFDEQCSYNQIPYSVNDCKEHNEASLEMSRKSMVLLKNNGVLPLDPKQVKTIGVVGPNANTISPLIGNYFGTASRYTTNLEGIQEYTKDFARVLFSEGCHLYRDYTTALSLPDDRLSEAKSVASYSDVVVVCLGLDSTIEGEEGDTGNDFAGGDKIDLQLPKSQQRLLQAMVESGKPVIVVVNTGSAIDLGYADQHCDAIIQAWYNGAHAGQALAELLFGAFSPSGKLPITFYHSVDNLPDFKDYSMQNRTYRYFKGDVLYPFGFGLSYSQFEYSNFTAKQQEITAGDNLSVCVTVKNTGDIPAGEVVQFYIRDMESSQILPNHSLCGFEYLYLQPNESKTITVSIPASSFEVVDQQGQRYVEPGDFTIYAGSSQPDKRSIALTQTEPLSIVVSVK